MERRFHRRLQKIKEPTLNATKIALCPAPVLFTEASCRVWLLGGSMPCAETPALTNITKRSECLVRLQARSHTAPCRSSAGSLFIETYTPHSRCRRCRGAFSYTESAAWFLHSIRTSSWPASLQLCPVACQPNPLRRNRSPSGPCPVSPASPVLSDRCCPLRWGLVWRLRYRSPVLRR